MSYLLDTEAWVHYVRDSAEMPKEFRDGLECAGLLYISWTQFEMTAVADSHALHCYHQNCAPAATIFAWGSVAVAPLCVGQLDRVLREVSGGNARQLERIANADIELEIRDIPAGPCRTVLQQMNRKVRDARFRQNVLTVHGNRCAVSGMQLDLVDAAQIIPVDHESGTDELKNGICLSALHHRAFDACLIAIQRDYSVILIERRLAALHSIGWDGGAAEFKASVRDQILLPARRAHYPDPEYLAFGQQLRGWSQRHLG